MLRTLLSELSSLCICRHVLQLYLLQMLQGMDTATLLLLPQPVLALLL